MKISKNLLLLGLFLLATVTSLISCKKGDDEADLVGNWIDLAEFGGDARSEAVAFTINDIAYVGTGYNGDDRLNDFWSYNAATNNWTAIAVDPLFVPRTAAVAFTANNIGYVGTGRDNTSELKDFWSYDPSLNLWQRIADFPIERYAAVAFSIDNIGYVGTGYNGSTLLDFYKFTPGTGLWTPITNYPSKVREAVAFVIDNMGFVCTGEKNGVAIDDFYMYDPAADKWTAKRKVSDVSDEKFDDDYTIIRQRAVAFVIGGKAYISTGDFSGLKDDTWEYDFTLDEWTEKTGFEGKSRNNAVAFTIGDRGFVTTGVNGASSFYDDLFEFKPADEFDEED